MILFNWLTLPFWSNGPFSIDAPSIYDYVYGANCIQAVRRPFCPFCTKLKKKKYKNTKIRSVFSDNLKVCGFQIFFFKEENLFKFLFFKNRLRGPLLQVAH